VSAAGTLVRLGIRVRPDRAELALADLLPVLGHGAEERALGDAVEYAVYGPAAELPADDEVRALAGEALLGTVREPVAPGWERRWHEFLAPVEVAGLRIRAPWLDGGRDDLVIDPGLAFGTGGHPTTRLALELLAGLPPSGALCDWGAGTGVLAIAAARLGWRPVTAVEIDPAGVPLLRANALRNRVRVDARRTDLTREPAPWAPTVVANVPAPLHAAAAAALVDGPPELLIATGMLATQADAVAATWAAHGLAERERRIDGEWAGLVLAAGAEARA
jgi:ribosomal protein L11 methyltransferase